MMIMTKMKLGAAATLLAILAAVGGGIVAPRLLDLHGEDTAPTPASTSASPSNGSGATGMDTPALDELYGLREDEDLRVIRAPFSRARSDYADAEYPYAKGADNIKSLGFWWDGRKLEGSYMSYGPGTTQRVMDQALRIPWYQIEHLERIDWETGASDWIVRRGLPIERALAAFAHAYRQDTGRNTDFAKRTVTRPCIVQRGEITLPPPRDDRFTVAVITVEALPDDELRRWIQNDRPKGSIHRFQMQEVARALDAPFYFAGQGQSVKDIGVFYIDEQAQNLSWERPDFRANLRKVLDNLEAQLGGEWSIEDRTFDVWRPVVGQRQQGLRAQVIGEWNVISAMDGGRVVPDEERDAARIVFDRRTLTMRETPTERGETIRYTIDESVSPAHIDLTVPGPEERVMKGLIEFRNGELRVVFPEGTAQARSTAFESQPGDSPNDVYMVLQRADENAE